MRVASNQSPNSRQPSSPVRKGSPGSEQAGEQESSSPPQYSPVPESWTLNLSSLRSSGRKSARPMELPYFLDREIGTKSARREADQAGPRDSGYLNTMWPFFRSEGVFQRVVLTSLDGRWINFTLRPEPDHPKDQEDEAMKNRFIPRGLIFCITCIIAVTAFAQGKASRGREGNAEDFVVVPDEQAMAAKQNVLKKIDSVAGRAQQAPNVVLILADDLGYADTAVYGSRSIPTPHIDALADAGVRFTEAYVTAATCSPSRAALMTGRYQQRFGFEFNTSSAAITHRESRGLDPAVVTLADVFQRAGYATGMFGKWHLGTRDYFHPQQRGFDEFFGFLAGAHSFFPAELDEPAFSSVMRG